MAVPVRKAASFITLAGAATLLGAFPAAAQQTLADNNPRLPPATTSMSNVSPGDCAAFRHYILDEAKAFSDKMSGTFLTAASRFTKAGCKTSDAQGEIQLITETEQDGISLRTARGRMGKVDILGLSGVKGCHRPPNGVCPAQTGAIFPRPASGG